MALQIAGSAPVGGPARSVPRSKGKGAGPGLMVENTWAQARHYVIASQALKVSAAKFPYLYEEGSLFYGMLTTCGGRWEPFLTLR